MKIKVTTYKVCRFGNRDTRLTIGIAIDTIKHGKPNVINTSAVIQLYPIAYFHRKIVEEAFGLLFLSAIIYAIDRSVNRHIYSIDGWSREFEVECMIPAYEKFQSARFEINKMLSFLTGDYWDCNFIGEATINYPRFKTTTYFDDITQVNLFSGGMDSLIGAINYLAENPKCQLFLASHYDPFMKGPRTDQRSVRNALIRKYPNKIKSLEAIMISPGISEENSCRSRSLMFLSIATIVATYAHCDLIVPENGPVSLNFPLSPSRRASCSTRTTHPLFLSRFQKLLSDLGIEIKVSNPYEFHTKGEMVQQCIDKSYLLNIIPLSNSCGKRNMHQLMYDNSKATHCSHCMPCMYRKAALVGEHDLTTYGNSLDTIFKKRNDEISDDFFAMLDFLKTEKTPKQIEKELYIAGLVGNPNIDRYTDLVIRTRAELTNMLRAEKSQLINQYMGWI